MKNCLYSNIIIKKTYQHADDETLYKKTAAAGEKLLKRDSKLENKN